MYIHKSLKTTPSKVLFGVNQRVRFVDGLRELFVDTDVRDLDKIRKAANTKKQSGLQQNVF